tara:strand:+ start:1252 stop:1524 length:273 start_codon:yes stop_codon:yes gene_type:complete
MTNNQKSFSVNLTTEEWNFLLIELEARRNTFDEDQSDLLNASHKITNKIEKKSKSVDTLKKENKELKKMIDKQHEEIKEIKNKLKDILSK